MRYLASEVKLPHWVDTVGKSGYVDVRLLTADGFVFRFLTNLDRAHASTTPIFIAWMIGGSLFLLLIAIVFLRKPDQAYSQAGCRSTEFRDGTGRA